MKSCPEAYLDYRIGIDYTFEDTCILFSMIGAGFGVSFATANFNSIYWSETSRFKRFLRAFIGGAITVGIYLLSSLFPNTDHITMYCFRYALPHLLQGFIVFGFVPVLCKYIRLVKSTPKAVLDDIDAPLLEKKKMSKSFHHPEDEEFFGIK